jgi:thioredoxin-related protein
MLMRAMTRPVFPQLFGTFLVFCLSETTALAQEQTPAPAKPTTVAGKASIYDKSADTGAQLTKAVERAKHDDKRILVMFGGDWCGWCHKLHELFTSDNEIRKILSYEYVLVMVDTTAPGAEELFGKCKAALSTEELKKGVGFPFLGVLDSSGKVVTAQRTDPLETGDHHDPARVKEFLKSQAVTPKDAEVVLRDGLARASSEDKRVFLSFGAPWCGWCHQLSNWMNQPEIASILDRDFVMVKIDIDRMTHGKDVMAQVRPKADGGIPWFAVLDAKGKPAGTSDGPEGNIGYPFKPAEIDHFMALITKEGRRLEANQLERLRRSLQESAEKIENEQKARQAVRPATAQ